MINIENAKKELINHIKELKIDNSKIQKKLEHCIRVSAISKEIATQLKLEEEQIQLAELIGLLHDIGRFEQYKIENKNEREKFDHGEASARVLKKDNYIRKYIEENTFDNIIYTAVYEHNKYKLTKGLSEEKELFCKIIKDADKIDLIYEAIEIYWQEPERIKEIEEGKLSEKMLEDFYQHKLADKRNSISETDEILTFVSFVFDINFSCSIKILRENNNISKMIDRFNYQVPETKCEMMKVKKIANEYLVENI